MRKGGREANRGRGKEHRARGKPQKEIKIVFANKKKSRIYPMSHGKKKGDGEGRDQKGKTNREEERKICLGSSPATGARRHREEKKALWE